MSVKNYSCSSSPTSRTGSGGACWCFASGSWSYSGNSGPNGDNVCPAYCPSYCGV
jgi:hypothetical protein